MFSYLPRKYSVDCVCRDTLPGLFTNRTGANQGTNGQKWVPESLLWFSLRVLSLGKKAGWSPSFLGAVGSPPLLDSPPDLNCLRKYCLDTDEVPCTEKAHLSLGKVCFCLVHGANCSSWPTGRALGASLPASLPAKQMLVKINRYW